MMMCKEIVGMCVSLKQTRCPRRKKCHDPIVPTASIMRNNFLEY